MGNLLTLTSIIEGTISDWAKTPPNLQDLAYLFKIHILPKY